MIEKSRSTPPLLAAVVASVWILSSGSARGDEQAPAPTAPPATEEGFVDEVQEEREEHAEDAAEAMEEKNEQEKREEAAPADPQR